MNRGRPASRFCRAGTWGMYHSHPELSTVTHWRAQHCHPLGVEGSALGVEGSGLSTGGRDTSHWGSLGVPGVPEPADSYSTNAVGLHVASFPSSSALLHEPLLPLPSKSPCSRTRLGLAPAVLLFCEIRASLALPASPGRISHLCCTQCAASCSLPCLVIVPERHHFLWGALGTLESGWSFSSHLSWYLRYSMLVCTWAWVFLRHAPTGGSATNPTSSLVVVIFFLSAACTSPLAWGETWAASHCTQ